MQHLDERRRWSPACGRLAQDLDTDDVVPALDDDIPRPFLLFNTREDRLFRRLYLRQFLQQFRRYFASLQEISEADGSAMTLEPSELALIRIKMLHPELRRVRVHGGGAYTLNVDT